MARPKGVGLALCGADVVHCAFAIFVKDTVVVGKQLFQAKSSIDDSYKLTGKRLNRQIQFLSHFFNFFDRDKDKARRAGATFATPGTGKESFSVLQFLPYAGHDKQSKKNNGH